MKAGGGKKICFALQLEKATAKMNKGRDILLFEALHKRRMKDRPIDGYSAQLSEFTVLLLIHVTWRKRLAGLLVGWYAYHH